MSTGIELIPVALAIGAAAAAARARGGDVVASASRETRELPTRFADESLLMEALGQTATERDGVVHGVVDGVPIAFTTDDSGAYVAHFRPEAPGRAAGALRTLDGVYGRLVQRDARSRVLASAPRYGLPVEDEHVEEDGTIVLTLQVGG